MIANFKNGFANYMKGENCIWITAAEANGTGHELAALWAEIKLWLNTDFPEFNVSFYIDPTNTKLLEAFINHPEMIMDFVSFQWDRSSK